MYRNEGNTSMTIMNVTSTRLVADAALDTRANDYVIDYTTFADNSVRRVAHLTYSDAMTRADALRKRGYRVNVRRMFTL